MECVLDKSGVDETEGSKKMVSWRIVAGAIRSLVSAKGLQHESARVLNEGLLLSVPLYRTVGFWLCKWTPLGFFVY